VCALCIPVGRPVCPPCTPCGQTSLHTLQTLLADQSAHSAYSAGGPVCTLCRPHWWTSWPLCTPCWWTSLATLHTLLADQSSHSAHPAGRPVWPLCTPCWWTSLRSLQTLLADQSAQSAQSAQPAGGTVCQLPSFLISICSYCISYWMLYSLYLVFSKCDAVRGLRRTRPSKGGLMDEMLTLDGAQPHFIIPHWCQHTRELDRHRQLYKCRLNYNK
jgi:hypothetical protein